MRTHTFRYAFLLVGFFAALAKLPAAPTAAFTFSPASGAAPLAVAFNAAGSTDPDGAITSYAWDFDNNGTTDAAGVTASHTYSTPGNYAAKLTVTSSTGQTASTIRTVPISMAVQQKVNSSGYIQSTGYDDNGDAYGDQTEDHYPVTVASMGTLSITVTGLEYVRIGVPGGGDIGDFGDTATLSATARVAAGTHDVVVGGIWDWVYGSYSIVVTFQPDPQPPVANFSPSATLGATPFTVNFDASASTDPDTWISSYAWDFDNNGTTDATGVSTAHTYSTPGTYIAKLTLTDGLGLTATVNKSITVNGPAPVIMTQPVNTTVDPGATAQLSVVSTGNPAPTYQWKKAGVAISGATLSSLTFTGATVANAGSYSVVVANSAGSATSNAAALVVNPPASAPVCTAPPLGQSCCAGGPVTLSAAVCCFPAPTCQWYRNGVSIAGATSATLSLPKVRQSDAGSYTMTATNSMGSVTTSAAVVSVVGYRLEVIETTDAVAWGTGSGGLTGRQLGLVSFDNVFPNRNFWGWTYGFSDNVNATATPVTMWNADITTQPLYCTVTPVRTTITTNSALVAPNQPFTVTATTTNPSRSVTIQAMEYSVDGGSWVAATMENGQGYYNYSPPGDVSHPLSKAFQFSSPCKVVFRAAGGDWSSSSWATCTSAWFYLAVTVSSSVPPSFTTQPTGATVEVGQTVTLVAQAAGAPIPSIQWRKDGVPISGATEAMLTVPNLDVATAGVYTAVATNSLGTATSNAATLAVIPRPVITSSIWAFGTVGEPLPDYDTRATFAPDHFALAGNLAPGLQFDTSTGRLSGTPSAIGMYGVTITASNSSYTSNPIFLRIDITPAADQRPSIFAQPASQTVVAGQTATFSVGATGYPAPTYQWAKGGVPISGATNASYTITSAQAFDAGTYTVTVNNGVGSPVDSAGATLTVSPSAVAPTITQQPQGLAVVAGGSASFTAAADGAPAPTYQWSKNGVAITGATNATLSLTNLQASDAGAYTVTATNSGGAMTSISAILTVRSASIDLQIQRP